MTTAPGRRVDKASMLAVAQASVRAALDVAPWPRSLVSVATDVLAEPRRTLGGHLTPWTLFPLCCCAAACGDWRRAIPAATAAELYITALDLFDDVEDGDTSISVERHGIPVVLNLATALLAVAHTVLIPTIVVSDPSMAAYRRAQDALWSGLAVATGGQHVDLAAAGGDALSVEECLDIARCKGGALAEACCRAGAAFGTEDFALIDRFGVLGHSLGLLGQLDNDRRDAAEGVGKSDLTRRKQTIPIAVARAAGEPEVLHEAVWQGGVQLAYALVSAENLRAREALEAAAVACPEPARARAALRLLVAEDAARSGLLL